MKLIGIMIFSIWFFGAGIMVGVSEVERKYECIGREGLLKGFFWCETDPISNSEKTSHILASFFQGLRWPIQLFSNDTDEEDNTHTKNLASSLEEFDNSPTGTLYKCYIVAVRVGLHEDASILAKVINKIRKKFPALNSNHEDFLLYTSTTIDNLIKNELGGDFISFFDYACKEPVKNMKQVLNDGIF